MVFLLLPLSLIEAFAEVGDSVEVEGLIVEQTEKGNKGGFTFEGDTLTISEKATSSTSCGNTTYTEKTTTVKLKNNTGADIKLKFTGSLDNGGSATIGGASFSSGMEINLAAGGEAAIAVTSAKNANETKLTLTIERSVADQVKTTFLLPENGSYSVDGEEITAETEKNNSAAKTYELVATPASGYSFFGWYNENTETYVSYAATYKTKFDAPAKIKPVFVKSEIAIFGVGSDSYYELDKAINAASSGSTKTIILLNDGTLAAGNYTIPSGVTLLIPYDSANTLCTTKPTTKDRENDYGSKDMYYVPEISAFRTLTMETGANITVNGAISVSGSQLAGGNYCGSPTGPLGYINMREGSTITVNDGGNLYVWGYICGSGSVTIERGGTIYEDFQVNDWSGGTATTNMLENKERVFPMSQFSVQNVEVLLTIKAGASEKVYMSANITLAGHQGSDVPFCGDDGMFKLSNGYLTRIYNSETGKIEFKLYGDASISPLKVSMKLSLIGTKTIDSAKYDLPINGFMRIEAVEGTVTMNQSIALLPGAELIIGEGANGKLGSGINVYVYDFDAWGNYCGSGNKALSAVPNTSAGRNTKYSSLNYLYASNLLPDAKVIVNGTIDASQGNVYLVYGNSTTATADITGTGKVIVKKGSATATYQATYNGEDKDFHSIAVKNALLKNADGTYVSIESIASDAVIALQYDANEGKWICVDPPASGHVGHNYLEEIIAPTCTTDGTKTSTCLVCGNVKIEILPAAHTEVIDAAKDPTCTETGLTEGSHCSVCGETLVAQTPVDALGHNYDAVVTDPTCTENGFTTHTCSRCGDSYIDSETNALGHDYEAVVTAPTCTEKGYTTYTCACGHSYTADEVEAKGHSYDEGVVTTKPTCEADGVKTFTCANCGDTKTEAVEALGHNYSAVVTDPTCTEKGYTTYTCACGHSYTADEVEAKGHSYDDGVVTTKPTCEADGVKTFTCANCGDTYTEVVTSPGHNYDAVVTAPTCTEKGYTTHTCSACGNSYTDTEIDALDHNYDAVVTAPTCTEKGFTTHTCSRCGDSYIDSETDALGHSFEHGECVCGDVKLGDTNGDGDVTTSDVGILNAFVLGKISLSEEQLILADVNGDGKITTADVALLNAYALGKIQL